MEETKEETLSVQGCTACGEDHESALLVHTDAGGGTFTCPNSGNPVNFTYPPDPAPTSAAVSGITEGRIVHYVMPPTRNNRTGGEHRAAIINNAHGGQLAEGMVNLTVFLDPLNDGPYESVPDGALWGLGSVKYSEGKEFGTWHWPERA